jgi:hypothetical protein
MVRRSMPMPQPAVGGSPYSRAVTKPSSTNMASSSPAALSLAYEGDGGVVMRRGVLSLAWREREDEGGNGWR